VSLNLQAKNSPETVLIKVLNDVQVIWEYFFYLNVLLLTRRSWDSTLQTKWLGRVYQVLS